MAKSVHRFEYARFGEALVERGLIDREVLAHVLRQIQTSHALLPEVLVRENLVSDWELSRVACEIYHLPFLTVGHYPPSNTAMDGYDLAYLRHFALVPLDRYGGLVTVIMPGLVPSEVLDGLRAENGGRVLPVVGSVITNRRWLDERFAPKGAAPRAAAPGTRPGSALPASIPLETAAPLPKASPTLQHRSLDIDDLELEDGEWGNLFDAGDEAVQLELKKPRQ